MTNPQNPRPSKNALSHGFYATDVVLAWEDPAEFSKLHEALRAEYWPDGFSEEAAVFDMAIWHWKKRRLNIGSQLAFHRQRDASAIAAASSNGWQGVADYLATGQGDCMANAVRAVAKSHLEAAKHVCDTLTKHTARICGPDEATAESEQSNTVEFEKLMALANGLKHFGKHVVGLLRTAEDYSLDQTVAEQAYRPDIMEKELKLHAEVDRRIEKAMIRLARAKEHKKFYGAKSIDVQNGITSLPAKLPLRN